MSLRRVTGDENESIRRRRVLENAVSNRLKVFFEEAGRNGAEK
jgi:hypothetical protein